MVVYLCFTHPFHQDHFLPPLSLGRRLFSVIRCRRAPTQVADMNHVLKKREMTVAAQSVAVVDAGLLSGAQRADRRQGLIFVFRAAGSPIAGHPVYQQRRARGRGLSAAHVGKLLRRRRGEGATGGAGTGSRGRRLCGDTRCPWSDHHHGLGDRRTHGPFDAGGGSQQHGVLVCRRPS